MAAAPDQIESARGVAARRGHARWTVRVVLLLAAGAALLPALSHTRWPVVVPGLSPLVAIAAIVATRSVTSTMWIGIAVAAVSVGSRRWFCRWVCPTGTCAELAGRPGLRFGRRCPRWPALGPWIAWAILGGAVFGYPVLLWLDPLALFSGVFGIAHNGWSPAFWWSALGLAGVLLLSAVWPGFWCLRTCPLGAVQDALAFCGRALSRAVGFPGSARKPAGTAGLTRRTVLGALTGVVGAAAGVALATWARAGRAAAARPLRPPGALDETRFAGVCVRCGNCSRACPAQIIRLDLGEHGIAGLLTPRLDFREDYCREDCTRCTEVCPSGALTEVAAREKPRALIGFPRVDMNICLLGNDRDCSACQNWCPYDAVNYVFSETEYTLVPQIDPKKCPGCGACEAACPTRPARAIVVEPR